MPIEDQPREYDAQQKPGADSESSKTSADSVVSDSPRVGVDVAVVSTTGSDHTGSFGPEADLLFKSAIRRLCQGVDLDRSLARELGEVILQGRSISAQVAAVLMGLATKGETAQEILGIRDAMVDAAIGLKAPADAIDIVGIGGSKRRRKAAFNVSTMASIIASAAGATVAKHGNRKATSTSGSFDLLEALGVEFNVDIAVVERSIDEIGLGFAFAPSHHPAMRYAGSTRAELGVPTVFNLVGPLTNPAGVKRQLLGVSDLARVDVLAEALVEMDMERVWLVVGDGSLDEATIWGRTSITVVEGGSIRQFDICPEDAGLRSHSQDDVGGGDAGDNAVIARSILRGDPSANSDMVLLNAAAALCVAGVTETLSDGVQRCRDAISSGGAQRQLDQLISITKSGV